MAVPRTEAAIAGRWWWRRAQRRQQGTGADCWRNHRTGVSGAPDLNNRLFIKDEMPLVLIFQATEGAERLRFQRRCGAHTNASPEPDLHAQVGQEEDRQLCRRYGDPEEEERRELLAYTEVLM